MTETPGEVEKPTRLRRLVLVLAAGLVVCAVVYATLILRPPPPLEVARQAVAKGDFQAAVGSYLEHLAGSPDDWGARNELGLVLSEIDRPQALVEFRKIPPESEAYLDARRQIATLCLATDRLREAEEALTELVEKQPDDWAVQLMLAELYYRQQKPAEALPHARRSAELNGDHPRTHFLTAELLDELRRPREMIAPLERVLVVEPDSYPAHLNLAYAYHEAGQPAESRTHAAWCLARDPSDVNVRRFLALAERDEGHQHEALEEVQRALALAPQDVPCRLLEAELLLFEKQADQAFERLKSLDKQYPDDRRIVALLARAAAAAGKKEEAEQYRKQVQKLSER